MVFEVRTFSLGAGGAVVAVRGELDAAGSAAVAAEVGRHGGAVVVDLLRAHLGDLDALDDLVARCEATFVAERPLRDALDVIALRRHVLVQPSLAAALA
jgi:hypothetical protein